MKMKRDQLALTKAIDSGDTDLGELLSLIRLDYIDFLRQLQQTYNRRHLVHFSLHCIAASKGDDASWRILNGN